jgi:hypothetical protein
MSTPTIEQIQLDLDPWHHDKAHTIQDLHKLIMMLNKSQYERLYKAMRDITDASLVIDNIYEELNNENNYYRFTHDGTSWPILKLQRLQSQWKFEAFESLFKCPIDEVIFLYQRVAETIPSLRKLWFSD